jgi:hypothetical protein
MGLGTTLIGLEVMRGSGENVGEHQNYLTNLLPRQAFEWYPCERRLLSSHKGPELLLGDPVAQECRASRSLGVSTQMCPS